MSKDTKSRILYVLKCFIQKTDEQHLITIQNIIDYLADEGISAYRKTIISDIEELQKFGFEIICIRSSQNKYYIKNSIFTLSELKLLVDAVEASQFITSSKSAVLIGKLSDLTSCYNADDLCRHIYLSHRIKNDNESIYETIDRVHFAMGNNRQISFLYTEYDSQKNLVYRNNGKRYTLSPYGMTWEDGKYYVIGYSLKRDKIVTFRVDRMKDVNIDDIPIMPAPDDFDIAKFVKKMFRMYGEDTVKITLKCKNRVMKSVIDRFGLEVETFPYADGQHFKAIVEVTASQTFFGWVFQFGGDIQIVKPSQVKQKFYEIGQSIFYSDKS